METVLQSDNIKAKILAAVASGSSVSEAAKANGITTTQVRSAISRLCRTAKLSADISDIQESPKEYLELASLIQSTPQYALRTDLRRKIQYCLRLKSADEITPRYISNLTSEMILDAGITEFGLYEIQQWLVANGVREPLILLTVIT